jgi:hypothetical protein
MTKPKKPYPVAAWTLLLTLAALPAAAAEDVTAPPSGAWRTFETPHFRVHFPARDEVWARAVAGRLEAVRAEVLEIVGHAPEGRTDVVLAEPIGRAGARALPFREGPRMVLFPTPPTADGLTSFADWLTLAIGHEQAHLAHLSSPPESKVLGFASRVLPIYPVVLQLPPWLTEAYAIYVESRLACAGDPQRPLHRLLLRRLAARGALPGPGDLGGATDWPGIEKSELVGAAFVAWLERRHGRGSLAGVWRRMTAGLPRSFQSSFAATFGTRVEDEYARFVAELEAEAEAAGAPGDLGEGRPLPAPVRTGLAWAPDGHALVLEEIPATRRPRLVVVTPEDAEPLASSSLGEDAPAHPRWLADGSLLFSRTRTEGSRGAHHDLFRWWPGEGREQRLTRGADVTAADPSPDGSWAVALWQSSAGTALMRVDLSTGDVEPLTEPSLDTLVDAPRIGPEGRRLAYLRHRGDGWRLIVRDLASGAERDLGGGELGVLAAPAWSPDGRWLVVTAAASRDRLGLEAWPAGGGVRRRLTPPWEIATAGAPSPDGKELAYLALGEHGLDLRRRPWAPEEAPAASKPAGAGAAADGCSIPEGASEDGPGRPYGLGPATYSSVLGGVASPSALHYVGGFRAGDVIGRWEAVAVAGVSDEGAESGGIVSATWRGWRLPVVFHGYSVERRPSRQPENVPGLGRSLDLLERGFALQTSWRRDRHDRTFALTGALLTHRLDPAPLDGEKIERFALLVRAEEERRFALPGRGVLTLGGRLEGVRGVTDSDDWWRAGGGIRLGLTTPLGSASLYHVEVGWQGLREDGAERLFDRLALGGTPSSLVPADLDLGRVYEPALPAGTAIGDRWQKLSLSIGREQIPARLIYARQRMWDEGGRRGDWLDLAGIEISLDRGARPLVRLPSSRIRVGAAYVLDAPFRHQTMVWAGISWTL